MKMLRLVWFWLNQYEYEDIFLRRILDGKTHIDHGTTGRR